MQDSNDKIADGVDIKDTKDSIESSEIRVLHESLVVLHENVKNLYTALDAQKKTTKNALKLSIFIGLFCVLCVVFNFSVLFTIAGGVAGSDRKLNSLQEKIETIQKATK